MTMNLNISNQTIDQKQQLNILANKNKTVWLFWSKKGRKRVKKGEKKIIIFYTPEEAGNLLHISLPWNDCPSLYGVWYYWFHCPVNVSIVLFTCQQEIIYSCNILVVMFEETDCSSPKLCVNLCDLFDFHVNSRVEAILQTIDESYRNNTRYLSLVFMGL